MDDDSGNTEYGGDCSQVLEQLLSVQRIQATCRAFAAILDDGSAILNLVVTALKCGQSRVCYKARTLRSCGPGRAQVAMGKAGLVLVVDTFSAF